MDHITPFDTIVPARRVSRGAKRLGAGLLVAALTMAGAAGWAHEAHRSGAGQVPGGHTGMFLASPERVARMVDRMLDGVNVSDTQRAQVKQIAQAASVDLRARRDAGRLLREKGALLFIAPTVDAAEVESVRQQMLAQYDASSRRITQAMIDISKVLTPEQRVQITQRMKERAERRHHQKPPQSGTKPAG